MYKLTKCEMITLKLLIKGYRNAQIGEITHVSLHTVKAHVSSILRKLGAKNRTSAVSIALENKICVVD